MTWPFENDTSAVEKKIAVRSIRANKRRNLFAVLATALTAFMITSIFSVGFSYFETHQLQQVRMMGTTADAAVTAPTEMQLRKLADMDCVSGIGISQRLGSVDASNMEDAYLGIVWLDEEEWKTHRLPAVSNVTGAYPTKQNEMMLPTWVLTQMGIDNPDPGMEIEVSYQLSGEQDYVTSRFVLSGYYTDYMSYRTNNRGAAYVSAAFRDAADLPLTTGGSAMITFSDNEIEQNCNAVTSALQLSGEQTLEVVPVSTANGTALILCLAFIALLVAFSGYLLIYNVFYISVSRDTQFYGQLKALGATKKQIRRIVSAQIRRLALIGIPTGLLLGAAFSLGIVPYALDMLSPDNAELGTKQSFSPLIFIGSAVFTYLTAVIGNMKPAKIAGAISPVAALRYTGMKSSKTAAKRKTHGIRLCRMAWENFFREKKSAALVFSSLFLGLCLFLVATGLFSSLSPENFVKQWGEADFVVTCDLSEEAASVSEEMIDEIRQIDGIDRIRLTYSPATDSEVNVVYDVAAFGAFVQSLDGKSGLDLSTPEKAAEYTENFYGFLYGLDGEYVKELTKADPDEIERFESGETLLLREALDSDGNPLFQPGQKITVDTPSGPHTFTVAEVFLDADFQIGRGSVHGTAPDMFISRSAMSTLFPTLRIYRAAFDSTGNRDKAIQSQLESITASQPETEIISRYDKQIEMGEYIATAKVLGMGISLVLLLIGVMNFINTMVVSVNSRRHEFAILESVGMTKKQIKKVLLYEGVCYFGLSFALVAVFGSGLYALLYSVFVPNVPYAVFVYPIIPMLIIAVLVFAVYLFVPLITYKAEIRNSVTERLRVTE